MDVILRLTTEETDALRRRAELEGRSVQDVARPAIREYVDRSSRRALLAQVLDDQLPQFEQAVERLGE